MRRPKPAAYELLKLEAIKVKPRVKKTLLAREVEVYTALKKLRDICKTNQHILTKLAPWQERQMILNKRI